MPGPERSTPAPPSAPPGSRPVGPNPFVGPRSIQKGEHLFGREREVNELYHLLQARRIVLLHSPSGAGKSSLVNAGLVPRLTKGQFDVWRTIRVNTDPRDIQGAAEGANRYVLSALMSLEEELPEDRRRSPADLSKMTFSEYVRERPRKKGRGQWPVVLIFDQFEEILTVAPTEVDQKKAFFESIGEALDTSTSSPEPRAVWALFILREEFLGQLSGGKRTEGHVTPYRDLVPTQLSNTFRLDLLDLAQAEEAAARLALGAGRSFPGAGQLVRDLSMTRVQRADGTPEDAEGLHVEPVQLQVVCRGLWDKLPGEQRTIGLDDVKRHAQVSKALATYYAGEVAKIAKGAFAPLPAFAPPAEIEGRRADEQRKEGQIRDWMADNLIKGDVRYQVRRGNDKTMGLENALIEKLKDSYLVREEQRAGAVLFELSHDRLVQPIRESNEAWDDEHLPSARLLARNWDRKKRPQSLLLRGGELKVAEKWLETAGLKDDDVVRVFVAESKTLRKVEAAARRWRIVVGVLIVLFAATMLVASLFMFGLWRKAEAEKTEAEKARNDARAATDQANDANRAEKAANEELLRKSDELESKNQELEAAKVELILKYRELEDEKKNADLARESAETSKDAAKRSAFIAQAQKHLAEGEPRLAYLVLQELFSWRPAARREEAGLERRILSMGVPKASLPHESFVDAASWSPAGDQIATVSNGLARLWSADGKGTPERIDGMDDVAFVAFAPAGDRMVFLSKGGASAWVWKAGERSAPMPLAGHTKEILFATWNGDGSRILTGSRDGTARVWSAVDGKELARLDGNEGGARCGAFSHGGNKVIVGAWDRRARIFRAAGGAAERVLGPVDNGVSTVGWSSSDTLVVTTWEGGKSAQIWNAIDGAKLDLLEGHGGPIRWAAWHPKADKLLTTSDDRTARVWSPGTKAPPAEFRGHGAPVIFAEWSPTGERLLTTTEDGSARVWNANEPSEVVTLEPKRATGDRDRIFTRLARWSPSGARILTASSDGAVRVWNAGDLAVGTQSITLLQGERVRAVEWSFDPHLLITLSGARSLTVWDISSPDRPRSTPLEGHKGRLVSATWRPGTAEKWLMTRSEEGHLWVWDVGPRGPKSLFETDATQAVFRPDGKALLTVEKNRKVNLLAADGSALPVAQGAAAQSAAQGAAAQGGACAPRDLGNDVGSLAFAAGGKYVLFAGAGKAKIWETEGCRFRRWKTGDKEGDVEIAVPNLRSARLNSDGKLLLTISTDGAVALWNVDGSTEPKAQAIDAASVSSAAWSPRDPGAFLTQGGTARLWRVRPAGATAEKEPGTGKKRDDGPARVVRSLDARGAATTAAAWSPDGARIATGDADGKVRVWDVDGAGEGAVIGADGSIRLLGWSADGGALATLNLGGTVKVWRFSVPDLDEPVRDCLTASEREESLGEKPEEARRKVAAECRKKTEASAP